MDTPQITRDNLGRFTKGVKLPYGFQKGYEPWNRGVSEQLNTGRTHFKKGYTPWNKGIDWKEMQGENHPRWKGENTKRQDERNDSAYKQWRLGVLRRDDYRCMICGEVKKGEMQADHIYGWTKYPRLRYELENGQALCRGCHKIKTKYERSKSDVIFATQ